MSLEVRILYRIIRLVTDVDDCVRGDEFCTELAMTSIDVRVSPTRFLVGVIYYVLVVGKVHSQLALQPRTFILRAQTTPL